MYKCSTKFNIKKAVASVLAIALIFSILPVIGQSTALAYGRKYGTVSISSGTLNVRSGAGTGYSVIGSLEKNETVEVVDKISDSSGSDWYKIVYGSSYGYVSSGYISLNYTAPLRYGKVTGISSTLNVRSGAGTSYSIKTSVSNGTSVTVLREKFNSSDEKWYYIKTSDGTYGYVLNSYVAISSSTTAEGTMRGDDVYVRSGAGTSFSSVTSLSKGAKITIISEAYSSTGGLWYKAETSGGKTGYIHSDYVIVGTAGTTSGDPSGNVDPEPELPIVPSGGLSDLTPEEFEEYLTDQGFPESYKDGLRALHEKYPAWVFKAMKTGLNWADVIDAEYKLVDGQARNTVLNSSIASWKSTQSGAYNPSSGTYVIMDSGGWVAASEGIIKYYMDPRNFFGTTNIFQFLEQSFDGSVQTVKGVESIVAGTFLAKTVKDTDGKSIYYPNVIYEAGKKYNVNPYVLASMIIQEVGTSGNSGSISGTNSTFPGYFNFYNIGAYKTSTYSAVERGLWYAAGAGSGSTSYSRPWNTRYKAIMGGAEIYASSYIEDGQNTLYLKKFNVQGSSPYTHQYMTNVAGASNEANQLADGYPEQARAASLSFYIPVYKNMPSSPCPKPTDTSILSAPEVSATSASGKVKLSWDSVENAVKYWIYRKEGSGSYSYYGMTKNTSYTNSTVNCGSTYSYKVKAVDQSGKTSDYSNEVKAIPLSSPELTATVESGKIKLSWNSVPGAVRYWIYRSVDGGAFSYYDATNNKSYTNSSVSAGHVYAYKIMAVNTSTSTTFKSAYSNVMEACILSAPTLSASSTDGKVKLSWNSVENASKYWIYRKTDNGTYKYYDATTKTTYTNSSVNSGSTYSYKIKAVYSGDYSDCASEYSNVATTMPLSAPELTASVSSAKVKLSWSSVPGATKYWLYRSVDGGSFSFYDGTTNKSYTNSSVSDGHVYAYKVMAVNASSSTTYKSGYSNIMEACLLSAPTVSAASTGGKIKLSWNSVENASKYWIYRQTDNGSFKYYDSTTKTTYTNSSVNSGSTYSYKIMAVYSGDYSDCASEYSNIASAIPLATPNLTAEISSGKVKLSWDAVPGATRYWLYRSVDGAPLSFYDGTANTSYTNSSVSNGHTYTYKILAVNSSTSITYKSADSNVLEIEFIS